MEKEQGGGTDIRVKVLPRSSKNQIIGKEEGAYRVKLTSAPVDGQANRALIKYLAKTLGLSKRNVNIISGERSRTKRVRIQGLATEDVNRQLEEAMGPHRNCLP